MAFESKGVHVRSIHDSSVPCNTGIRRASGAQRKELSRPEEVRVAFLTSNIRPQSQRVHSSFARRARRWARMPQAEGPTGTKHRGKQEEVLLLAQEVGRATGVWQSGARAAKPLHTSIQRGTVPCRRLGSLREC